MASRSSALALSHTMLRTNQPGTQGVDAPDGLSRGFRARLVELVDNGRLAGLPKSQVSCAGSTAEGANVAHVLGLFVKQAGVSKVHFSGSLRLTFIDREALRSPVSLDAVCVLMSVVP